MRARSASFGYTADYHSALPYHSQLGLLEAGLAEKKKLVLSSTHLGRALADERFNRAA